MSASSRAAGGRRIKTVLAAVDFSPVTPRVVAEAIALARADEARVILLNVTTPKSAVRDYAALEAMLEAAEPRKRAGAPAAAVHGESLQLIGEPVEVILRQAARCSADYIVMGSHGHTALFELVVGGTAAGVIRGAPCPIILIPPLARKVAKRRQKSLRRKDPVAWLQRTGRTAEPVKARRARAAPRCAQHVATPAEQGRQ